MVLPDARMVATGALAAVVGVALLAGLAMSSSAAPAAGEGTAGVVRVTDFGAVGDGETDCTAAFRRALQAVAHQDKGATVIVPPGRYKLTDSITVQRCLLTGLVAGGWPADAGPMPELEIAHTKGPGIIASDAASINGLTMNFQLERGEDGPKPSPPAILLAGNGISITNLRLHGAYDGIIADGKSNIGRLNIENVFMPALYHCGVYVTRTYDIPTLRNIEVWVPHDWNITHGGIGFRLGRNDCIRMSNCFAFKCAKGFVFDVDEGEGGGATWGEMCECGTDACAEGIVVKAPVYLNIHGGTYWDHFATLHVADPGAEVAFTGAMAQSNGAPAVLLEDCKQVTIMGCQFRRAFENTKVFLVDVLSAAAVTITGCIFSQDGPGVRVGEKVTSVLISDNIFRSAPGPAIENQAPEGAVVLANNRIEQRREPQPQKRKENEE
ncbi:MAG: hypothetical protein J7M26_04180 [Armatimonadetes bacterium]|nr:hypothetical protein [Armatimonadota bacterium]